MDGNRKSIGWRFVFLYTVFALLICLMAVPPQTAQAASKKKKKVYDSLAKSVTAMVRKNPVKKVNGLQSTDEYASMRLIVRTKKKVSFKKYKPKQIIGGAGNLYFLQFRSISACKMAAKKIKKLKSVVYVEPDRVVGVNSVKKTSSLSWGVANTGLAELAEYVASVTSAEMRVAVIDTGVYNHPFLKDRLVKGVDTYENSKSTMDRNGHGTHIAGIITDCTPGLNVKIVPVRVSDDDRPMESEIAFGIYYAYETLGAKVINLSLGYSGRMRLIEDFINSAVKKDCVVVVSSGNNGDNINKAKFCPAYMNNVLTVGAVDSTEELAYFSNYGRSLDVVAPGTDIYSTWKKGKYKYQSGTSMAAPYAAALAAQLRLLYPEKNQAQIRSLIQKTARDLGDSGKDLYFGYGLIQSPTVYTQLELEETAVTLAAGEHKTIGYALSNPYMTGGKVIWKSSDSSVASVSANGMVTGIKQGKATITASACGKSASCSVSVTGYSVKQLALNTYADALRKGDFLYEDKQYTAYFAVINLDMNEIPELLTADTQMNNGSFTLCGVNGKILDVYDMFDVSVSNHSITAWYYPNKGLLYTTVKNQSQDNSVAYILDFQYAYLPLNKSQLLYDPEFPITKSEWYYKNGSVTTNYLKHGNTANAKISKEVFEKEIAKYVGNTKPVQVSFSKNTVADRERILGIS